ncbi:MAG: hypothetical protein ABIL09_11485, partial [Gemmatimonadota bacterium]
MRLILPQPLEPPGAWALQELRRALHGRGAVLAGVQAEGPEASLVAGLAGAPGMAAALRYARAACPPNPESLVIAPLENGGLVVAGRDARGLAYALSEVARAVESSGREGDPLAGVLPAAVSPYLSWRSMQVFLCNPVLEGAWVHDRGHWDRYLGRLARCRFNNLSLTFAHQIPYLAPPYPFFVAVPEFGQVRARDLEPSRRQANLETLRMVSQLARERGLHFTLAVWSQHAHSYGESQVEGLTSEILAGYCAAGLGRVLEACPAIDGVQLRLNAESGVPEEEQGAFFEPQFRAVAGCGRPIRLDLRAKGLANRTIDLARSLVGDVVVSTKHWCEHLGLPYPMPAIQSYDREHYRRYGSWDLLEKPRPWPLVYRLWSAGTQRVLQWGDPAWVRRFVESMRGSAVGFEVMAPLTNKGVLDEARGPWPLIEDRRHQPCEPEGERYWLFELLFGRLGYRPDESPEVWRRELRGRFGAAAAAVEEGFGATGPILPLVTVTQQWSASLWSFWPELFAGRSLTEDAEVEPSDPTQFYGVAEYAADALAGRLNGKWTPWQVARYLRERAEEARRALDGLAGADAGAELPGTALDLLVTADLGEYWAWRLVAVTHLAFHRRTGEAARVGQALTAMEHARRAWAALADRTEGVYAHDLVFGRRDRGHCGHWRDRLAAIDAEVGRLWGQVQAAGSAAAAERTTRPGEMLPGEPPRAGLRAPAVSAPGRDVELQLELRSSRFATAVQCHYRIANQSLPFRASPMAAAADGTWG